MPEANQILAFLEENGIPVEMVKKPNGWGYHAHLYSSDELALEGLVVPFPYLEA